MRSERVLRWALSVVAFLAVVDLSVVAIALPQIQRDLGFSVAGVQWVMTGYALTQGGLLLVAGRLADRIGRRRVLVWGLAIFAACSVLAAVATTPAMLVGARLLQGAGGAAMLPSALALLTVNASDEQRERALGTFSAMSGAGFITGVIAGGVLAHAVGWRAVMLFSVPLAAASILAVRRIVPESRTLGARSSVDLLGAVALIAGLAVAMLGLGRVDADDATATTIWGPLAVGALLLTAFVAIERRAADPILPLGLLRRRTLAAANTANVLKSAVGMAQLYMLTLLLQHVAGATPLQTGIAFVPMALAGIGAAVVTGRYQARFGGARLTALFGCALLLAGLMLLALQVEPTVVVVGVLAAMIIIEIGFMTAEVPLNLTVATALPERRGLASGMLTTSTELGNALGLALTAAIVGYRTSTLDSLPPAQALAGGLRWGLAVAITAVLLTAGLVMWGLSTPAAPASDA